MKSERHYALSLVPTERDADLTTESGRLYAAYHRLQSSGWRVGSAFTHPAPQRQQQQSPRPVQLLGYI